MVHSHHLDWYHVWNVHGIPSPENHQPVDSKIVKLVQQTHSHSNLQHLQRIVVVRNVHLVSIQQLVWLRAHHVHTTSIKMLLDRQHVMNAQLI